MNIAAAIVPTEDIWLLSIFNFSRSEEFVWSSFPQKFAHPVLCMHLSTRSRIPSSLCSLNRFSSPRPCQGGSGEEVETYWSIRNFVVSNIDLWICDISGKMLILRQYESTFKCKLGQGALTLLGPRPQATPISDWSVIAWLRNMCPSLSLYLLHHKFIFFPSCPHPPFPGKIHLEVVYKLRNRG